MGKLKDRKERGYKEILFTLAEMSEVEPNSAILLILDKRMVASGFTEASDNGYVLGVEKIILEAVASHKNYFGARALIYGPFTSFHEKLLRSLNAIPEVVQNGD